MKEVHELGANEPVGEWILAKLERPKYLDDCTLCGKPVLGPFYFNSKGYGWIACKKCVDDLADAVEHSVPLSETIPTVPSPVVVTTTTNDDYTRTEAILSDISASLRLLARIWEEKK